MMATFLALFGLAVWLNIPILVDPSPLLESRGAVASSVGVGLLLADVLLPVPSSLIMTAHGALFGIVIGTLLSLVGSVGAAGIAFLLGRRGSTLLDRWVTPAERTRADALIARWGGVAIVLTRPLPLLAETVALLAGTSPMRWRTLFWSALAGNVPPALLYAVTGATAATMENSFLMFALILGISGVFFVAARRLS